MSNPFLSAEGAEVVHAGILAGAAAAGYALDRQSDAQLAVLMRSVYMRSREGALPPGADLVATAVAEALDIILPAVETHLHNQRYMHRNPEPMPRGVATSVAGEREEQVAPRVPQ